MGLWAQCARKCMSGSSEGPDGPGQVNQTAVWVGSPARWSAPQARGSRPRLTQAARPRLALGPTGGTGKAPKGVFNGVTPLGKRGRGEGVKAMCVQRGHGAVGQAQGGVTHGELCVDHLSGELLSIHFAMNYRALILFKGGSVRVQTSSTHYLSSTSSFLISTQRPAFESQAKQPEQNIVWAKLLGLDQNH